MFFSRAICFFCGHRRNIKFQITQGYKIYICDRCKSLFAVRKDIEDMQTKRRIEKKQKKQQKKEEKIEKRKAKEKARYEAKFGSLDKTEEPIKIEDNQTEDVLNQ